MQEAEAQRLRYASVQLSTPTAALAAAAAAYGANEVDDDDGVWEEVDESEY